jgi:opacity protein-like surface antigen
VEDFDETYSLVRFVYTPRISVGILRLGASWERFSFGMADGVQTPDLLQSVTAVVGFDTQFSDSILVRIEAQPGFYGSEEIFDTDTFNVPFIIGGTYIYNSNLQFIFGLSVDFERDNPVLPGGGIRWRVNSQWVLNAVLPTPRLEFEATKNLTLYAGANLKNSTFRTNKNFGDEQAGDSRLNRAVITYTEVRAGVGVEWKLSPEIKLALEAGYMPWREFDFHRTNVRYHNEEGAPYGAMALSVAF